MRSVVVEDPPRSCRDTQTHTHCVKIVSELEKMKERGDDLTAKHYLNRVSFDLDAVGNLIDQTNV